MLNWGLELEETRELCHFIKATFDSQVVGYDVIPHSIADIAERFNLLDDITDPTDTLDSTDALLADLEDTRVSTDTTKEFTSELDDLDKSIVSLKASIQEMSLKYPLLLAKKAQLDVKLNDERLKSQAALDIATSLNLEVSQVYQKADKVSVQINIPVINVLDRPKCDLPSEKLHRIRVGKIINQAWIKYYEGTELDHAGHDAEFYSNNIKQHITTIESLVSCKQTIEQSELMRNAVIESHFKMYEECIDHLISSLLKVHASLHLIIIKLDRDKSMLKNSQIYDLHNLIVEETAYFERFELLAEADLFKKKLFLDPKGLMGPFYAKFVDSENLMATEYFLDQVEQFRLKSERISETDIKILDFEKALKPLAKYSRGAVFKDAPVEIYKQRIAIVESLNRILPDMKSVTNTCIHT
jgi:hypothetical protein